jgi:hypothetical protein
VTSHLWQRLAVLLQKGNAALILNRTPEDQDTLKFFVIFIIVASLIASLVKHYAAT